MALVFSGVIMAGCAWKLGSCAFIGPLYENGCCAANGLPAGPPPLVNGWFPTGDVATIDADGYMQITDRSKDVIKSGGEWISSVDLENALMAHPDVAEAAVIAIPDPKWSERPLACIVLKPGKQPQPEAFAAHLLQHGFAKWQVPDPYEFIDAVPRTSTGKFYKLKLRERFPA